VQYSDALPAQRRPGRLKPHKRLAQVKPGQEDTFDHVCFDMNPILHTACRKASTVEAAVFRVYRELDATLKVLIPRKSVVLAFDGPGPYAKLLTQRKRRGKASKVSKYALSSLNITPGTTFMHEVKQACMYYVCVRLAMSYKFRNVAFYLSGADVPGEGEVKILEWIHNLMGDSTKHSWEDSIMIVGGDADLVLQVPPPAVSGRGCRSRRWPDFPIR